MTQPPEYPPPTPYAPPPQAPAGGPPPWQYPQPGPWQPPPHQGWTPPAPQPVPAGTNKLAIAALVTSILGTVCFASFVLGVVAVVQTVQTKQKGRGLAIAALVVSCLWLVGALVAGVVAAIDEGNDRQEETRAAIAESEDVSPFDLAIGDCLILTYVADDDLINKIPSVPCTDRHDAEVYAILKATGAAYPGSDGMEDDAADRCEREFDRVLHGDAVDDRGVGTFYLFPTETTWAQGDRELTCLVTTDKLRRGSLRD